MKIKKQVEFNNVINDILKNDEVKNIVDAKGKVYAEVWYKVKVSHPFIKKENIKTNNAKIALFLSCLSKMKLTLPFSAKRYSTSAAST